MRYGVSLRFVLGGLLASAMPAGLCFAQQQVISAQSGTVQYVEGSVYADGKKVERKFGQFPSLRPGDELRTEDGRAEVLLTPGAFLRLDDHSSVNMVSNRLTDTRVEVFRGTVMVECDELLKDNAVSLIYRGDTIQLEKHGLYRLDTQAGEFRVYEGEARVQSASGDVQLKAGHETSLNSVLASQHFDSKLDMDDFYHWSAQRSSNLAYATVTASQSVLNSSSGPGWTTGGWMWSSLLDEYTFLPGSGLLFSPFGYGFYSPLYMGNYYTPVYAVAGGSAAPVSSFGTRAPGTQSTGRSGSGTATNPRAGTPRAMGLAVASNSLRAGSTYGGVAAITPRSFGRSNGFGNSRGGSAASGSSVASSSASSSGGLRGGGGFSGGHGGGFGGGHR